MENMKKNIAIAVNKNENIWYGHFGISPYFLIFDNSGKLNDKRINPHGAGHSQLYHDNPKLIIDSLNDCGIFVCKIMGEKSKNKLAEKFGIKTILTEEKDVKLFLKNYLQKNTASNNK